MAYDMDAGHAPLSEAAPQTLPAWTYVDREFFELEQAQIFKKSWQFVCHVDDIRDPGDFERLDLGGESVVVVRGADGLVRAFHNVCRHRGAKLLTAEAGQCGGRITCPYHAWTYRLDGRLIGVPGERDFLDFDKGAHGLVPVAHEVWHGFVFIRLQHDGPDGGRSVADLMAPYAELIAPYRIADMVSCGQRWGGERAANWKVLTDNYSDGFHVPYAHPGLNRLIGRTYRMEVRGAVHHHIGQLEQPAEASWSEQLYLDLLPAAEHLPPPLRRSWAYFRLFPNFAFSLYPEQVDIMHMVPLAADRTLVRMRAYHPAGDNSRQARAARYLNWRINRDVQDEDDDVVERTQAGMTSSSFVQGPLARTEICLIDFAQTIRGLMPAARLRQRPPGPLDLLSADP